MAIQLSPEDLLRSGAILALAGMGGSALNGGASRTASILTGGGGGVPVEARRYEEDKYPTRFTPGTYHTYDVQHIDTGGVADENSVGQGYKDVIHDFGLMQTLDEHNQALTQFVRPGMDPVTLHKAIMAGQEAEKRLKKFWDESSADGTERAKFTVSSSAVSGIRITPDGRVQVKWAKPSKKNPSGWYTFKQYDNTYDASKAAQRLMDPNVTPSIGRAVYPVVSRNITKRKNGLGDWNEFNYDPAFAG